MEPVHCFFARVFPNTSAYVQAWGEGAESERLISAQVEQRGARSSSRKLCVEVVEVLVFIFRGWSCLYEYESVGVKITFRTPKAMNNGQVGDFH